jgi:Tol biopolymer transport system component
MYEFVFDPDASTFAPPVTLTEVNSDSDDFDPDLREGGLFLAFDSDRAGLRQIYWTRRPALDAPFATPAPLTPNAVADESAVAFSEDLRYLMFSSNAMGSSDIYERFLDAPP